VKNTVITPPAIRLKITGNCNRSCFFCHQEGDMEGIFNISPDIKFFECLDNIISALCIDRIMVTGGEPLLHPQLLEIINGIKTFNISITTNGTLLKSQDEWKNLHEKGLTKAVLSINGNSPRRLLSIETKKRSITWASNAFQNQIKNLINLHKAEITTRVNVVASGVIMEIQDALNFLLPLSAKHFFEIRLLELLGNVAGNTNSSQEIISSIIKDFDAVPIKAYRRDGSSSFTQYYRTANDFEFSTKTSFPYFFDPICKKCSIREQNKCFEGFYGPRIEKRQGGYHVRLCLYRHDCNTLLPWQNFLSSGLANEMKNIFQQV